METLDDEPMNFSAQTTSHLDCKLLKWTLTQDQTKAIEKAWDSYKDYWESTKEEFLNQFKGFTIYPIKTLNGVIGCVAVRDNEIHIFATDKFNLRKYVKAILVPLLNEHKEVISTVHSQNLKALKFVTRLGFKPYNQINNKIKIRITQDGLCC
jgi:hypothetical protein